MDVNNLRKPLLAAVLLFNALGASQHFFAEIRGLLQVGLEEAFTSDVTMATQKNAGVAG